MTVTFRGNLGADTVLTTSDFGGTPRSEDHDVRIHGRTLTHNEPVPFLTISTEHDTVFIDGEQQLRDLRSVLDHILAESDRGPHEIRGL